MAVHPDRGLHPIRVLHALACLALACWFGLYVWRNHPVRKAFETRGTVRVPAARSLRNPTGAFLPPDLAGRVALLQAALPDVLGGLVVLVLVSLGTGVYVWQFEVWLEAHLAGEAASLRGVGLDQAALGANKDRKKGAVL